MPLPSSPLVTQMIVKYRTIIAGVSVIVEVVGTSHVGQILLASVAVLHRLPAVQVTPVTTTLLTPIGGKIGILQAAIDAEETIGATGGTKMLVTPRAVVEEAHHRDAEATHVRRRGSAADEG